MRKRIVKKLMATLMVLLMLWASVTQALVTVPVMAAAADKAADEGIGQPAEEAEAPEDEAEEPGPGDVDPGEEDPGETEPGIGIPGDEEDGGEIIGEEEEDAVIPTLEEEKAREEEETEDAEDVFIQELLEVLASINSRIAALPGVDDINEENCGEVLDAIEGIMDAMADFEETYGRSIEDILRGYPHLLDMEKFRAVQEKAMEVAGKTVGDVPAVKALPTLNYETTNDLSTAYPGLKMELYKADGFNYSTFTGTKLANNDTVHKTDEFVIVFKMDNLTGLTEGTTYKIAIANGTVVSVSNNEEELNQTVGDDSVEISYGMLGFKKGKSDLFLAFGLKESKEATIGGGKVTVTLNMIEDISLAFKCKIDESKRPATGDKLVIDLGGADKKIELKVDGWGTPDDPTPADIEKNVTPTSGNQNNATWTIKYTPPADGKYAGNGTKQVVPDNKTPDYIVDELPAGLELDGTPTVKYKDGTDVSSSDISYSYDSTTRKLTWTLTKKKDYDASNVPISIVYKTKHTPESTDEGKIGDWSESNTKTNNVYASNDGMDTINNGKDLKASQTIKIDNKSEKPSTSAKSGKFTADGKSIEWSITVDPKIAGSYFTKFELKDTFGAALDISSLTKDSFVLASDGTTKVANNYSVSGTTATIDITDYVKSRSSKDSFQIKYTTPVKEDYFQGKYADDSALKNTVHADWSATAGTGSSAKTASYDSGTANGPITSHVPDGAPKLEFVDKSFVSYDVENRRYDWKIGVGGTFNSDGSFKASANLFRKIVLYEEPEYHSWAFNSFINPKTTQENTSTEKTNVEASIKNAVAEAVKNSGYNNSATEDVDLTLDTDFTVTVELKKQASADKFYNAVEIEIALKNTSGDLRIKPFTFSISTYSTHVNHWVGYRTEYGTGSEANHNYIIMRGGTDKTLLDTIPLAGDQKGEASYNVPDRVPLKKTAVSVDLANKRIKWQLEVNDKTKPSPMGNIKIEDTLPANLVYVSDSIVSAPELTFATLTSAPADPTSITTGVHEHDGKLDIYISGVTTSDHYVITYETEFDFVNHKDYFMKTSELGFENKVKLYVAENLTKEWRPSSGDPKAKVKIPNKMLDKTNVQAEDKQKISYTVTINPLKIKLINDPSLNVYLEDKLGEGMVMDEDSIRVYTAKEKAAKTSSGGNDIVLTGEEVALEIDQDVTKKEDITYTPSNPEYTVKIKIQDETAYIIKYDAYIMKKNVEINNSVKLVAGNDAATGTSGQNTVGAEYSSSSRASLRLPGHMLARYVQVAISKVNASTSAAIGGVKFGLYSDESCTNKVAEGTTDDQGTLTFTIHESVFPGGTKPAVVYIKEITPASGYKPNNTVYKFETAKASSDKTGADLTIANIPNDVTADASVKIYKKDGSGNALAGAEFGIYMDEACSDDMLVGNEITGADGTATFTGLINSKKYWIKEIKAPAGYLMSDVKKEVTTNSTSVEYVVMEAFINQKETGIDELFASLSFTKVEAGTTNPLQGAVFAAYSDAACTAKVQEATSGADGRVVFDKLAPNTTYWIKELTAPAGYELSTDVLSKATGDANSDTVIGNVENKKQEVPPTEANIRIKKVDSSNSTKVLKGAEFALYAEYECKTLIKKAVTNESGYAVFDGLERDKVYYVVETKAPSGYKLDKTVHTIETKDASGWNELTVKNDKKSSGGGSSGGGSSSGGGGTGGGSGGGGSSTTPSNPTSNLNNGPDTDAQLMKLGTQETIVKTGTQDTRAFYLIGFMFSLLAAAAFLKKSLKKS